jgi:hypothetical protein
MLIKLLRIIVGLIILKAYRGKKKYTMNVNILDKKNKILLFRHHFLQLSDDIYSTLFLLF